LHKVNSSQEKQPFDKQTFDRIFLNIGKGL